MLAGYVYFLFSSVLRPIFRTSERTMEKKPTRQTIEFSGSDPDPTFVVVSRDVEVVSTSGSQTNGISRIKASNVVDYSWEERFYTGQMLAVHRSGKYIAYGIKGKNKSQCTIRIVNRETEKRALMKDAEGLIEDLSFAQSPGVILLACVDNTGTLLVYNITENESELSSTLILHVLPEESMKSKNIPYRVFWCSYIPEDDYEDEEENSKLLAITRFNKVELWDVGTINPSLEQVDKPIKSGEVKQGYLVIEAHDDQITEAVFSPDGTAIATASLDGTCKFYQVYMPTEGESRCLHQWSPHHGNPVTTLFFLDDLRSFNPDVPFWKYAITATDNNSELSLWSCETWQRLQHIKFKNTGSNEKKFKIGLDISASIIVINDMPNKILYILELNKEEIQNTVPYIATVTELRLHYAILSFGIVDASIGSLKPITSPALDQHTDANNGEAEEELGVMMRMYIVQPKSLQSCDIAYPTKRSSVPLPSPIPHEEYTNGDCTYDIDNGASTSTSEEETKPDSTLDNVDQPSSQEEVVNCIPLTPPQPSLSLMTPDAFSTNTSSVHTSMEQSMDAIGIETEPLEAYSSPLPVDSSNIPSQSENPSQMKSGSSSPSREVEEILAMKNVTLFSGEEPVTHTVHSIPQPPVHSLPQPSIHVQTHSQSQAPVHLHNQPVHHAQAVSCQGPILSNSQSTVHTHSQTLQQPLQQSFSQTRVITSEDKSVGPVFSVAEVQDLKNELKTVCQILERQCTRMQELENEIRVSRQNENRDRNIEVMLGGLIDQKMREHQEKTEKLHSLTIEKMHTHQEETVSHICQLVDNSICSRLPPMIQSHLINMIHPAIKDLKDLMHQELTIKLTATDTLLKDNIAKMMKSKPLMELMAQGVAGVSKEGVTQLTREALHQAIPKIENVCSTIMAEMSETFSNGTAQYVSEVESHLKKQIDQWHVEANNLHATFLEQANIKMMQVIEKSIADLEDRVYKKLSKTLVKAVNSGVTSRVMTPAFPSNTYAEVMEHIHQGHLSEAFQQALSAAELPLVLAVCEKVPINQIFTARGSILPQPVILSLIQQLSSDMSSYSDTKHKYLEEAVMNLDKNNAVTREHMPKVLSALNKQLLQFMQVNPKSPLVRQVRMLQMATMSLINN